jgi:hypothetical protein
MVETELLATICATQWKTSVETASKDLAAIDPARRYEIRYEDLIKDDTAIKALVDYLQIQDGNTITETWRARVNVPKHMRWKHMKQSDQDAMLNVLKDVLKDKGYN